jgi:D-alanine-D-alanine ligase
MTPARVAVLGGGRSSEHEVSLASATSVAAGLRAAGHEVLPVTVARDGVWRSGGAAAGEAGDPGEAGDDGEAGEGEILSLVPGRGLPGADVVFPVLHGPFGEDGTVQGLLECLGVPYVGAGVLASALCMDKVLFKELMAHAGLPQVGYRAVRAARFAIDPVGVERELAALGLPVFVKPARLGSSVGIGRVDDPGGFHAALAAAFEHDPLAIVEAGSSGREVECAVLGNDDPIASEPGEILLAAGESGWYDYEAKYSPGGMELLVPARISERARDRVRALAVDVFQRSDCSGLARVDFFVEGETVLVNELNTMPGFTETSVYGALFAASGIPYPELLHRLVGFALERHDERASYRF